MIIILVLHAAFSLSRQPYLNSNDNAIRSWGQAAAWGLGRSVWRPWPSSRRCHDLLAVTKEQDQAQHLSWSGPPNGPSWSQPEGRVALSPEMHQGSLVACLLGHPKKHVWRKCEWRAVFCCNASTECSPRCQKNHRAEVSPFAFTRPLLL